VLFFSLKQSIICLFCYQAVLLPLPIMGNKFAKKDEKGKGKETTESKNTKKTHQKSPDNDNKRTGKTDPGTVDKLRENMNRSSTQ